MAKPSIPVDRTIHASPAKAFFVEMITRDIDLQDAMLDLLDNCVDGIRRGNNSRGDQPYKGYFAKVTFNENEFVIEDNCGGIPLDVAIEHAFMMGRPAEIRDSTAGTIGVYGIGMKRAIFKMGRSCVVHSYTEADIFEVEITEQWMEDDDEWDLEYRDATKQLDNYGTRIHIKNLNPVVRNEFAEGSDFRVRFVAVVRDAYGFLLAKGFSVIVNGIEIMPKIPSLLWDKSDKDESLRPYIYKADIDGVKVFLAVGFRERPETSQNDESNTEARYSSEEAGWTIVCNDRAVLSHDRTTQTGWGWGGVPSYHTQFIAITGYVIFTGNPAKLPMTTTKRGVDANSPLYTAVRARMQSGLLQFTKFTNDWKGHDAEPVFRNARSEPLPIVQHAAEEGEIKLQTLRGGHESQSMANLPVRPKEVTLRRITFIRSVKDIQKVSEHIFETADEKPSEVGAACFDLFLKAAKK